MNQRLFGLIFTLLPVIGYSQFQVEWNYYLDIETTKTGSLSNYYYNDIHRLSEDWAVDLAQSSLLTKFHFNNQWHFVGQLMVERFYGLRKWPWERSGKYEWIIPQLALQWNNEERTVNLQLGRFLSPFGRFYDQQMYFDRDLIGVPLAYGYYVNVSTELGYVENLGELTITAERGSEGLRDTLAEVIEDWGSPLAYRLGYKNGLQASFGKPGKWNLDVALVDGAPNRDTDFSSFSDYGIITRLGLQLNYFTELGISAAHGTYLRETDLNVALDPVRQYRQTLVGLDYQIGVSYFEFSGELIGGHYNIAEYLPTTDQFVGENAPDVQNLLVFSSYLDWKYEPPFISGSYIVYRIESLVFGNIDRPSGEEESWDNNVLRHALGVGYKITPNIAAKAMISTQDTSNRNWSHDQRVLRILLSFFL